MGLLSGSIPWFTMMILHKKSSLLQKVDDTLAVFHTHAIAGLLGGILTGILAVPELANIELPVPGTKGFAYGRSFTQVLKQIAAALFIIVWNIFVTTAILIAIGWFIPLRMPDDQLMIGDDAAHGEEAYALWGDGEKFDVMRHETIPHASRGNDDVQQQLNNIAARGVTIQL